MKSRATWTIFGSLLGLLTASAQIPTASQQVDAVQQRQQLEQSAAFDTNAVPELYADESADVGPQSVLQLKSRRAIFTALADVQYFYTDNMLLTKDNRQGVDVLVSTVEAVLEPVVYQLGGGSFSPRAGFEQQWFDYGLADNGSVLAYSLSKQVYETVRLNNFDFNAQTAFLDGTWRRQNWIFSAGGDYRRLMDTDGYNQFYSEFVPRWSAQRIIELSDTTALSLGYEGDYRITTTPLTSPGLGGSSYNRTDHSLVLTGSWKLCAHAILQPYYRFEYSHYTGIHREDYLNSFGLAVCFPLCKNTALRAFAGYDNLSTDGAFAQSYESLSAGGGLNLTVRF